MFRFVRQFSAVLLAHHLLITPADISAQQAASDSIPRELGMAILAATGTDMAASLRIGRPTDGFPVDVLPASTIILGSNDANGIDLTVIRLRYGFAAAADSLRSTILSRGWRPVESPVSFRRGFATPQGSGRGGRGAATGPTSFCKGLEVLSFQTPLFGAAGSSVISIIRSRNNSVPPCAAPARISPLDDTPMPALMPPTGATMLPGGSGGGGDEFSADARVTLASTVVDLVRHYSAQILTAGWTLVDSVSNKGVAVHRFTITTPNNGGTWDLLLTGFLLPDQGLTQMQLQGKKRR